MPDPQFCLMAIDHWSTCMTKAEWSGWMQAIGSVAAIAAGVAGLAYQAKEQKRILRTQEIRLELDIVCEHRELLEEAIAVVVLAKNHSGNHKAYREYLLNGEATARFDQTALLMKDTDRKRMPSAALKVAFSLAQQHMRQAGHIHELALSWANGHIARAETHTRSDSRHYTEVIYGLVQCVNVFDHHLSRLQQFTAGVDLDHVDTFKLNSRAERARAEG